MRGLRITQFQTQPYLALLAAQQGDKYRASLNGEGEKNTKWRFGAPPNYDVVNKLFEEGRTKIWPQGSLEEKVQNLLKSWEMEIFHKKSFDDFKTMDPKKYTFSLNGRKPTTLEEIVQKFGGGYNPLLQTSLPEEFQFYNIAEETAESSHQAFTTTFPRGFAIEVLQVYLGPPVIVFKFRHWGFMEGPFKGYAPTGEKIELYGMAIFELNEESKIVKVELFYDRGELLGGLMKGGHGGASDSSTNEMLSSCPIMKGTG
ncbi:hypothetical protein CsSME_00014635 [Camellia sinensis var. sinensis]